MQVNPISEGCRIRVDNGMTPEEADNLSLAAVLEVIDRSARPSTQVGKQFLHQLKRVALFKKLTDHLY